MARQQRRPAAPHTRTLTPLQRQCPACGHVAPVSYHSQRTVATLDGLCRLRLVVRRCQEATCALYRRPYRPEAEGAIALPHGEFGLDLIALIGALRFGEHRGVPEIHRELRRRDVEIAERSVTNLLHRYEELVALRLGDRHALAQRLRTQERVLLAIDGLQPDVGHEVLWVVRDCLSGEVLLARSLLSGREADLVPLLREVAAALPVPVAGVITDGQHALRHAVASVWPGVPHQLCQFHYLRTAALPISEADRHAKKELKKRVRGVRPIERALEGRDDGEAEAIRGYCLAVRSALTDDGRPPLVASGLRLRTRLLAIRTSIGRVAAKKGGCRQPWPASTGSWRPVWRRPRRCGRRSALPSAGWRRRPRCWATRPEKMARGCKPATRHCWARWPRSARQRGAWPRRSTTS